MGSGTAAVLAMLIAAGCRGSTEDRSAPAPGTSAPASNPHREPAREILERRCGKCHRSDSPDADPRALRVFTLNDVDFAAHMSDEELALARKAPSSGHGMDALRTMISALGQLDQHADWKQRVDTERHRSFEPHHHPRSQVS